MKLKQITNKPLGIVLKRLTTTLLLTIYFHVFTNLGYFHPGWINVSAHAANSSPAIVLLVSSTHLRATTTCTHKHD